jgi:DTW domain-containing protein YfiP
MTRAYCAKCQYPVSTCVCAGIMCIDLPTNLSIVVIQHPHEARHAKNTAKLAQLVSPSIDIILANDTERLDELFNLDLSESVLVYPNPSSQCIENNLSCSASNTNSSRTDKNGFNNDSSFNSGANKFETRLSAPASNQSGQHHHNTQIHQTQSEPKRVTRAIFIDSTWKQAYGIYKTNSSLQNIESVHFCNSVDGKYKIRRSKKDFQLSTIEAIAYTVEVLFDIDTTHYFTALNTMQSHWPKH